MRVKKSGNGDGDRGGGCLYSWLQNKEEVEITASLKKQRAAEGGGGRVEKSSVKVAFQPRKITVKCNGTPILEAELYNRLDIDGCTWMLDGYSLVIMCKKVSGGEIWP